MIRTATQGDIASVAKIADEKRHQYAHYAPTFWNPAHDAYDKHVAYLGGLLTRPNTLFLVSEASSKIDGFVSGWGIHVKKLAYKKFNQDKNKKSAPF